MATSESGSQDKDRPESKYFRRLADLETERKSWEDEWQRVTDYILPRRSGWTAEPSKDKSGGSKIFDGTALSALTLMSDGLLGHLVPASIPFFRLRSGVERFEDIPAFRAWLDSAELHLLAAIERSNLYQALGELFPDAGALGTAVMYMEESIEEGRMFFSVRHLKECFLAENRYGVVDTVYRRFEMTRHQMGEQFESELSEAQMEKGRKHPDERVKILHVVEPGKRRAWDSTYLLVDESSDDRGNKILEEGGYDYFPYIAWRFRKNSEEVYGRSPAMDAIYDVEMLNFIAKSMAEAAHKAINPPMIAPQSMKGRIKVAPAGMTYVDSMMEGNQIRSLYNGALGQYPLGIDAYERRAKIVRDHFRSDFFSYLLSTDQPGQRTATEINAIEAQKAAVLGSTIGRVTKEVFEPIVKALFAIEYRAERLPEVPPALYQLVGQPLEIEYTGPLARKQKQYLRSQGVLEGIMAAATVAANTGRVDMLDNFDMDYIATEAAESNGMPQVGLIDPKIRDQLRKQRAMQQAAMQQQALALEQAKVNPALSKAPEPGSPAEALSGGRR